MIWRFGPRCLWQRFDAAWPIVQPGGFGLPGTDMGGVTQPRSCHVLGTMTLPTALYIDQQRNQQVFMDPSLGCGLKIIDRLHHRMGNVHDVYDPRYTVVDTGF